ncbi:uncharacterized protein LOC132305014 [Cornus florida]|uniref:uncharacterized protein LOC132305014 n=1 Tax=Cornus florida TaxID=4283 RepID=UPI00289F50DA|nr:uncharacterized protein LOC132305014 [Cornus florida]
MREEAPVFDLNRGRHRRDKPPEFGHHRIASPWQTEFAGDMTSDPPYQPSMATIDYRSTERRSSDDRVPSRFSRENEALRSSARTVASPFTDEILNSPNLRKFSMPVFILFDGTTDLIDHIYHIQLKMALNTNNDPLMCKCFPISLAGPALNWFKNLAQGSIVSFQDLCDKFISQYYGNKRPTKDVSSLFTMKQHEDERLQAFLTRFNLVKSMVMECHPSTAVQAFKLAMNRWTPFHTSLVVNTPKTIDELNERVWKKKRQLTQERHQLSQQRRSPKPRSGRNKLSHNDRPPRRPRRGPGRKS